MEEETKQPAKHKLVVNLDDAQYEALARAAAEDDRTPTAYLNRVIRLNLDTLLVTK